MVRKYKPRERKVRPVRIEGVVAYILLTQGREAIIDAEDIALVAGENWSYRGGANRGYAWRSRRVRGDYQQIAMHRVIMDAPEGMHVDHINGNGLDNRRANLRLATPSQNCQNIGKRVNNSSGYKGVSLSRNGRRWIAQIRSQDKNEGSGGKVYLGTFDTPEDAYSAYCQAAKGMHKEFAKF